MRGLARDPRSFDHLVDGFDLMASIERKPNFFVEHLPRSRRRALDIGCGTGVLTWELAQVFDSVLGIDISEPMLDRARATRSASNIEDRREDANDLRIEGSFDAIVSHTTFHHLDDVSATLRRVRELVAPGGRVIVIDAIKGWLPMHPVVLVLEALALLPTDLLRLGARNGLRLFRFRVSKPWLQHLASDRFLTPDEFRAIYGRELPGAKFISLKPFEAVVWEAPDG